MTAILDASTLLKLPAPEAVEQGAKAVRQILPELAERHGLQAPTLLAWELANVLHVKLPAHAGADVADRARTVAAILTNVELVPPDEELIERAGTLAETHGLTAYDAAYLALSLAVDGSVLITDDGQLRDAAIQELGIERAMDAEEALLRINDGAL